jgi:chromosome partitioning protein
MTTILVATVKGGSGKTTISTNLAAALANGGGRVLLADLDRQRSATEWLARRPKTAVAIDGVDWSKEIGRAGPDHDYVIMDAPAALKTRQIEDIVGLADRIIVPVVPSAIDEAATLRFLRKLDDIRAIAKGHKPVAIVGNRVRTGTRSAERLQPVIPGLSRRGGCRARHLRSRGQPLRVAQGGLVAAPRLRAGRIAARQASGSKSAILLLANASTSREPSIGGTSTRNRSAISTMSRSGRTRST